MSVADRQGINVPLRINVALGLVVTFFLLISFRLWYLQILKGEFYRVRSENNRIRTVYVPPPRGTIQDRKGRVLVSNRPSFNIEFVTEDAPEPKKTLQKLADLLNVDYEVLKQHLYADSKRRRFEPKLLLKDVSRDVVARVSAERYNLPGVIVNVDPARNYLYRDSGAHALGYIREITQDQLESPNFSEYRFGDVVGQYGLEARWEHFLQGQRGIENVIVDAMGNRIGESSFQEEKPGNNLVSTIDLDVQKAADAAMAGKSGAVVAMNVKTGAILALSSAPSFDPNIFTGEVTSDIWKDLIAAPQQRLNDRAIQGAYPPGSVFKIILAIAGLSEGIITPNERMTCPGYYSFAGRQYHCWKHTGHGPVDLYHALVESCDVYFYNVGNRLGVDRIHEYATRFGFGSITGLGLVHENPGLIPSTAWKKTLSSDPGRQKWYPGETLSVAIGQGAVAVTPIQVARALSAVANGGTLLEPYLVERVVGSDGRIIDEHHTDGAEKTEISPKILSLVREGLVGVVNDAHGTGAKAKLRADLPFKVGGKTGTAQVIALDANHKKGDFGDHAWFAGFAPADDPQIAVVALVEHGLHGGSAAAPVVKDVLEAYFDSENPPKIAEVATDAAPDVTGTLASTATPKPVTTPTAVVKPGVEQAKNTAKGTPARKSASSKETKGKGTANNPPAKAKKVKPNT